MVILYCLMEYEPVRFNEMRRYLGRISDKTLSTYANASKCFSISLTNSEMSPK